METSEKNTIEQIDPLIEKQLRDRQNKKNNVIVFGLPKSKATELHIRREMLTQ